MLSFLQLLHANHSNVLFVFFETLEQGFGQDEVVESAAIGKCHNQFSFSPAVCSKHTHW